MGGICNNLLWRTVLSCGGLSVSGCRVQFGPGNGCHQFVLLRRWEQIHFAKKPSKLLNVRGGDGVRDDMAHVDQGLLIGSLALKLGKEAI